MQDARYLPTTAEGKLAKLAEECAEVIQVIAKIQQMGWVAVDKVDPHRVWDNRVILSDELRDLRRAMTAVEIPWEDSVPARPSATSPNPDVQAPKGPTFSHEGGF